MYNIIKDLEEVFKTLDTRGLSYEVPRAMLIAELKRQTSVFTDKTIIKWLKTFVELGYIKIKTPYTYERCVSFDAPYVFKGGVDYNAIQHKGNPIDISKQVDELKGAKVLKE